ncbi:MULTISPECIES: XRE family transcriptional regulator [Pseudomonas]|uniref:XRE family transcriptional regulator n=1 Tax=Pseudomonas TaxID=286 RepID=UPI001FC8F57A|nr:MULTISPECIES: helix-turn-helix transcriptional regulator [Pseudomonas]MDB1109745.1 helix-turn-helix transcriptional regulator [Pseudomonas extremaustralis]
MEGLEGDSLSSSPLELETGKFSERLREAIGAQSVLAFSKRCGISDSLVRKYLAGSLPGTDNLVVMAKAAGVSIAWLAAGEGDKVAQAAPARANEDDAYAYVPLYDARCSAGSGAWNERSRVLVNLSFTRYSLRKQGLSPANLACLRVDGDSMTGLLEDGDTVMIDQSRNTLEGEGVYVLLLDDHLYAKLLQRQFDGSVLIISHNKAYKELTVPRDRLDELQIVGRVVWSGGWMI